MIATLPMYDRPELRGATDALWAAIRDALRAAGGTAPDRLTRQPDLWRLWQDPTLILAQTCGLPFRARLFDRVQLVGTPDYGLPGCPAGHYNSVIIARPGPRARRPRLAINDPLSQSGWAALADWLATREITPGAVMVTGSHAASASAVREGRADLAAIDSQTWRLLLRHADADAALEIARTSPTPGLPLITALGQDGKRIANAVAAGIAALAAEHRAALDLQGLVQIDATRYRALPLPPNP